MTPSVLHVIPTFSRGGGGRALLAAASARGAATGDRVVSLAPAEDRMVEAASRVGLDVAVEPSTSELADLVARTDLLQLHFWNAPDVYRFLATDLPPRRTIVWCHVLGDAPPHVFPPALLGAADCMVTTHPRSVEIIAAMPEGEKPPVVTIPGVPGWDRLQDVEPRPHAAYTVGYVGTVDPVKMHPEFAELCARVDVPDARFVVCGSGGGWEDLARAAASGPLGERLELRGYIEDIGPVMAGFDVFGYPLVPGNSSTSELVLIEAMYTGVPPVVLPHGGAPDTVEHMRTGIVAADEDDYVRSIELLHHRPELRQELGAAAARTARARWDPTETGRQWARLYDEIAAHHRRSPPPLDASSGARMFMLSLGSHAGDFDASFRGTDLRAALEGERRIAHATTVLAGADTGGVLQWRIAHPDDGHLRYWAGLVFAGRGRHVMALAELTAAARLGCDHWRVAWHLARNAEALGLSDPPLGGTQQAIPTDLPDWARPLLEL